MIYFWLKDNIKHPGTQYYKVDQLTKKFKTASSVTVWLFPQFFSRKLIKKVIQYCYFNDSLKISKSLYCYLLAKSSKNHWQDVPFVLDYFFLVSPPSKDQLKHIQKLLQVLQELAPSNRKEAISKINILVNLGKLGQVEGYIERTSYLSNSEKVDELKALMEIKDQLGPLAEFTDIALNNTLNNYSYYIYQGNCNDQLASISTNKETFVEFYIPIVFFRRHEKKHSFYDELKITFLNIYKALESLGIKVIPKIQFNWREIPLEHSGIRRIAYHTKIHDGFTLNIKESSFRGYFTFDTKGFSGWHSINSSIGQVTRELNTLKPKKTELFIEKIRKEFIENKISKYEQPKELDLKQADYIFIPLQLPNDIVSKCAIIDTYSLVKMVIKLAKRHPELVFLIKPHPLTKAGRIRNLLKNVPKNISITNGNIHNLIRQAKFVLTVNSGVGAEALLYEKPVLSTGWSEYSVISPPLKTYKELETRVLECYNAPLSPSNMASDYLFFYFNYHLLNFNDDLKTRDTIEVFLRKKNI